jgi:hypothetical protein
MVGLKCLFRKAQSVLHVRPGKLDQAIIGADFLLHPEFDIRSIDVLDAVANVSGMISLNERKLLYHITKDHYTGSGYIIDGGMFLGASGVSLAEGLRYNAAGWQTSPMFKRMKPIQGYDIGYLPAPKKKPNIERKFGNVTYRFGESFVPIIEEQTRNQADLIEINIGDFMDVSWETSDPIEICFVDLAKTPELNYHVFKTLFPAFIPGKTILIQQDLFFDRLPWIKVLMGYLDEYFEWLGQVGPSSVYRYVRKIPDDVLLIDPYRSLPDEKQIRFHKNTYDDRLSARRRFALDVSLAYLYFHTHGQEKAMDQLHRTEKKFQDFLSKSSASSMSAPERIERARREVKRKAKSKRKERRRSRQAARSS